MGQLKDWYNRIFNNSEIKEAGQISSIYSVWNNSIIQNGITLSGFSGDVYKSDYINNAIDRIATEVSKLDIKSILENEDGVKVVRDDITRLFSLKPNEYQTTSDFLSCLEWQRRKHCNAFVYPQYDWVLTSKGNEIKKFKAFYVLNPTGFEVGINNGRAIEIKFYFADGESYILPYSDLIHMKWRRGSHLFLGGDDDGKTNNTEVKKSLNSLTKIIDGLPKSIEASLQIKGVYNTKSLLSSELLNKERDTFEANITNSKSGIIAIGLDGEFTPTKIDPTMVSKDTMEFIKNIIVEKYGVSIPILSGTATDEQHEAFFQTAIEDFLLQFEQAFSPAIFTERELRAGHRIRAYYARLRKLSVDKIIQIATLGTNTGLVMLDEIREMLGQTPLPNGEGKRRLQSLNYVNVAEIDSYQKSRAGVDSKEILKNESIGGEKIEK